MAKMSRLFKILTSIQRSRKTAQQLAEECEVTPRSIYRYIEDLEEAGIPIDKENGFIIKEGFFVPPMAFTPEEAIAILVALDSYSKSYDTAIKSAQEKIATVLNKSHKDVENNLKDRIMAMEKPRVDYNCYEKVFADFRHAIMNCISVQITYNSLSSGVTKRLIDPYAMFSRDKFWYIIGYCHMRDELLLFRVDRIEDHIVQFQSKFLRPQHFSVSSYMGNAWNVERGSEEFKLVVKFNKDSAPLIKNNIFHHTQTLEDLPDGSSIFKAQVSGEREIIMWLLSFGSDVEIIEPIGLRNKVKDRINRMSALYK